MPPHDMLVFRFLTDYPASRDKLKELLEKYRKIGPMAVSGAEVLADLQSLMTEPDLGARAGDELAVSPKSTQFPAVLRRTFALDDVAHVIGNCRMTELVYARRGGIVEVCDDDHEQGEPAAHPPKRSRHLALVREQGA